MNAENRVRSEELRFTDDAHHILESLLKEIHKSRRKNLPPAGVHALLEDLITFAEYQGYDMLWRSLLGMREMPGGQLLESAEAFVARLLDDAKKTQPRQDRDDAVSVPGRSSIAGAIKTMSAEGQRKVVQVVEIHLDIFNNLVHNLQDANQRAVYLDSLDNLIFSLRDIHLPDLQDMLKRHREFLNGPMDSHQLDELQRDLRSLGQLLLLGSRPAEIVRKGQTIDVRAVIPDLKVIMYNLRHVMRRSGQSTKFQGMDDLWRANVDELTRQLKELALRQAAEALKHLDRVFKNRKGDWVSSAMDAFFNLADRLAQALGVTDDVFKGHDEIAYRDLAAWQTDKHLYRLLDTEYVLQHQTLVASDRIPELIDLAGDLTALRASLTQLSRESRADFNEVRISHELEEMASQLTKITRRYVKATDDIQRIEGRLLLNRLEKEIVSAARKKGSSSQVWIQDEDVRMELSLVEDLENPLLELVRQFGGRVIASDDRIEIDLHLHETTYAYDVVCRQSDGQPVEIMGKWNPAITRSERLNGFVDGLLPDKGAQGFRDFIYRGLERLRCDVRIEPSGFTLSVPKRRIFSNVHILRSGEDFYLVPSFAVTEIRNVSDEQLLTVHGHRMLRHETKLIVAVPLHQLVHPEDAQVGHALVIVDTPLKPTGLLVDEVVGKDDIAVKPLDELLQAVPVFAGGAVLADGSIGLFIDPMELGDMSRQREASIREFLETQQTG